MAEGISVYCDLLEDIELEILALSIKECIKTIKFFPKVSEIIEKSKPFINRKTLVLSDEKFSEVEFWRKQDELRRSENTEAKGD